MSTYPTRRTRRLSFAALLVAGVAATSCQLLIGISGLELTGGAGGGTDGGAKDDGGTGGGPACTCDGAGQCSTNGVSCAPGYGCNAAGTACSTTCDMAGGCAPNSLCSNSHTCTACGTIPPSGPCPPPMTICDACDATETCVMTCAAPGACTMDRSVDAKGNPVRFECGDACDGITIDTRGGGPTEVICDAGCNGLVLRCSGDGKCALVCNGTGCAGAKVVCGGNECKVTCNAGPVAVQQICGPSCACTKIGCE